LGIYPEVELHKEKNLKGKSIVTQEKRCQCPHIEIQYGGLARVVECLPSKREALSSNPNTGKKKNKKERGPI
jgi:hypothetical protein